MRTNLKILFTVIALIIVIILVNILGPDYDEIKSQAYKSLKYDVYSGIVLDKYRDKNNHDYPAIRIITSQGTQIVQLQLDESGLYEFVEKKDSINKEYGSYDVKVFRNNELYIFSLDYGIE